MALLTNINGKFSVSDVGAVTFNNAFTFPTADGAANYVLQTNGSGQLAWALNGNGDISGSGTANTVTKFTGAKTIGNGPITFSSNDSTFAGNITVSGGNITLSGTGRIQGVDTVSAGTDAANKAYVDTTAGAYLPLAGGTMTGTNGVLMPDNFKLKFGDATTPDLEIYHDGSNSRIVDNGTGELRLQGTNLRLWASNGETYLTAVQGGAVSLYYNATKKLETTSTGISVSGTIQSDDITIVDGSNDVNLYLANTSYGLRLDYSTGDMFFRTNGGTRLTIANSGAATFAGTVTAPTFLGDLNGTINTVTTATTKGNSTNDTTVATTAFVQNVIGTIPAGLVFQGTWNASTNSPTLTSGSGTTGNFYIVSVAGSTNLDGITDWQVGDWAVFIEQGASDQWEKIDNSSVLSGSGTGGSIAGWSGSGTSVTLGNSPVTFSGNNISIPGTVIINNTLYVEEYIQHLGNTSNNIRFTTDAIDISANATFAGGITTTSATGIKIDTTGNAILELDGSSGSTEGIIIKHSGTEVSRISHSNSTSLVFSTGSSVTTALTLDASQNATFTGQVSVGNYAIPSDHQFQIAHLGQSYARFGLTNSQTGNGSSDGLKFQMENLNSIIKNQENGTLGFGTNGRETDILINSSGNVGIGTTSPLSIFQIKDNIAGGGGSAAFTVNNSDSFMDISAQSQVATIQALATGGVKIGSKSAGGKTILGSITTSAGGATYINFSTNGTATGLHVTHNNGSDLMTVLSSGNVGIGTDSPGNKLEIESTTNPVLRISNGGGTSPNPKIELYRQGGVLGNIQYSAANKVMILENESTLGGFAFNIAGSSKMVMDLNGNVGIGLTSPQAKLQTNLTITGSLLAYLNGTSATFDAQSNIAVVHNSPSIGSATAAGLVLANNDKSDGAPSPIIAFSAKSASNSFNHTYAAIYGVRTATGADTNWTKGDLVFATGDGTGPKERMRIDSSGNVGIGVTGTPSAKLDVEVPTAGAATLELKYGSGAAFQFQNGIANVTGDALVIKDTTNSYDYLTLRDNNVGIGTGSPSYKLDVETLSTGNQTIASFKTNESTYNGLLIAANNNAGWIGNGTITADEGILFQDTTSATRFYTNSAERMRISSTGDVGIGTTPTVGYNLDVKRTSPGYSIVGRHATGGKIGIYSSTGDNGIGTINNYPMNLFTNNSGPQVTLTTAGNVGIGTTNPIQKLDTPNIIIGGSTIAGTYRANALFMDNNGGNSRFYSSGPNGTTQGSYEFNIMASDANPLQTVLVINNSGNVGIGETSPDARLHISALASNGISNIKLESPGASKWAFGIPASQTYFALDDVNDNLTTPRLVVLKTSGNVGIGTTSPVDGKLQVQSSSTGWMGYFYNINTGGPGVHIESNSGSSSVQVLRVSSIFNGGNNTVLAAMANGNVGIGTTTPGAKLQVKVGSAFPLHAGNACGNVGIGVTSTDISGNGLQPQLTVKGNISYGYNNYNSVANTWSNALNFSGYPAGLYQVNICKQSNASAYIIAQVKWSGTAGTVINTVTSFQYGITFSGTQLQSIINTTTATSISVQCLVTFESCLP